MFIARFGRYPAKPGVLLLALLSPSAAISQQPEYILSGASSGIYVFRSTSGILTAVPGSPFATPAQATNLASDAAGRFVYAVLGNGTVAGFAINGSTGALTAVPGSPPPTGISGNQIRVHPSGNFLYVSNSGTVSGYQINQTTGAITPLTGSPYSTRVSGFDLAFDPAGAYVYVASSANGTVAILSVNQDTGALTPVPGSPFPLGINLASITVHPNGQFVYAADFAFDCCGDTGYIWGFQYNSSSGNTTPLPGSPWSAISAHWVATDPSGSYLYAASVHGSSVYGFTINQVTGALSPISGSPFPAGQGATSIAVEPTGQFLFQGASEVSEDIRSYSINQQSGVLTQIGSPVSPAPGSSVIAVRPTQAVAPVIVPSQGGNGGAVSFQMFGSGFESGATVTLTGNGPDIVATNVGVTNTSMLTGTFNLGGSAVGSYSVVVTNPDNTTITLPNGFTVQQGGAPQLWAQLDGWPQIRIGVTQTYYIDYGNRGSADALGTRLQVYFPGSLEPNLTLGNANGVVTSITQGALTFVSINLGRVPAGSVSSIPITLTATPAQSPFSVTVKIMSR